MTEIVEIPTKKSDFSLAIRPNHTVVVRGLPIDLTADEVERLTRIITSYILDKTP